MCAWNLLIRNGDLRSSNNLRSVFIFPFFHQTSTIYSNTKSTGHLFLNKHTKKKSHMFCSYLSCQHFIEENSIGPPIHWLSIGLIQDNLPKQEKEFKSLIDLAIAQSYSVQNPKFVIWHLLKWQIISLIITYLYILYSYSNYVTMPFGVHDW